MRIVIFITCAKKSEALKIADNLIRKKFAACVNITDSINSVFCWQGKVTKAKEVLLIVKSKKAKLAGIVKLIRSLHSYQVPEIIALPIIAGYKPYLEWMDASVR